MADHYPSFIEPTVREAERIERGGAIVPNEIAALLRHNADQIADLAEALRQERESFKWAERDCNEMVTRLNRLSDHLRTGIVSDVMRKLADYAGGFVDFERGIGYDDPNHPPPDPFPDPVPAPAPRRARRKGGRR